MASRTPYTGEPGFFTARVVLLVVFCFLPYAALPLGNNTNVPLSSLVALTFLPVVLQHPRLALLLGLITIGPFAHSMALIVAGQDVSLAASVAWAVHVSPLVGFAAIAIHRSEAMITPLYWSLIGSCVYAFVQLTLLRRGSIPFIGLYDIPGYASVKNQEYAIINYIGRPFGLFPEPSFLAGSLAMGTVLYLALRATQATPLSRVDYVLILAVAGTIFLTQSGSGVLTIGLILILAILPYRRSRWIPFVLLAMLSAAVKVGLEILSSRSGSGQNFSWGDRLGSLLATGEYVYGSAIRWLVGVGKGTLNELFLSGEIRVGTQGGRLLDTASVLLRLLFELGLPLGLLIIGSLVWAIVRGNRQALGVFGVALVLTTWLVVAGATITYDSAALIWAVPGVALGFAYTKTSSVADRRLERSSP